MGYSTLFIFQQSIKKEICCGVIKWKRSINGSWWCFHNLGYLNPHCSIESLTTSKVEHPHDPSYNIKSLNSQGNRIATVVLYIPSTGIYYSVQFVSDTSHLWAKGLWICNQGLVTKTILQMLPSNSLCI